MGDQPLVQLASGAGMQFAPARHRNQWQALHSLRPRVLSSASPLTQGQSSKGALSLATRVTDRARGTPMHRL